MPSESETSTPAASMTPRLYCKKCGYALVGLESRVCPECGREFDPGNRKTFSPKPPRGWVWRLGKRVAALVLLLMLIAGAGLGWLSWGWHAEQPTIARLRAPLASVQFTSIGPERLRWTLGKRLDYLAERVESVGLLGWEAAQTEQLDLGSLSHLQSLTLRDCEVSNSTLSHLAGLKKLQELRLWYIKNQSPDLALLEKLPALSRLALVGDLVDQAGLEHIGQLKHLKALELTQAGIMDDDLQPLQGLSSLEQLSLLGNPITDAGLEHLEGLKALRVLWIDKRLLNSPGEAKLKEAIPGLQVRGL